MSDAKRILLVTRNFPPLIGGMERLLYNVYRELAREHEVILLGPGGCEDHVRGRATAYSCRLSPVSYFLICLQMRAMWIARKYRPDLIVAGSGVVAPAVLLAARYLGVPCLGYLHGLDIVSPSFLYRRLFLPAIRRLDAVIVNSAHTSGLARDRGIPIDKIHLLHPGVTIADAGRSVDSGKFRKLLPAAKRKVLLSVGRLHPRKGLPEFIARVMPGLVAKRNDLLLVVIGSNAERALSGIRNEKERIMAAVEKTGMQNHVLLLGNLDDATLEQAYRASDLLVFPVVSLPGDVEGFGMVALEAAAQGLPTVAFAEGGVIEAVKPGVSGYLVKPGNYDELARVILRHLENENPERWRRGCGDFAKTFSWERFGGQLREICRNSINRRDVEC